MSIVAYSSIKGNLKRIREVFWRISARCSISSIVTNIGSGMYGHTTVRAGMPLEYRVRRARRELG